VRVSHIADSLRGFDSTKYKFRTDSVANSGYLPVHRLADSTSVLRTDLKRKDDTTSGTGYVRNHQLNDSASAFRTDFKRIDDTTAGTGYLTRSHTVNGKFVSSNPTLTLASSDFANQGTTTTVLHGNASGNPSFGSVVNADIAASTIDLTAKVTGVLPIANGGTNGATALAGFNNLSPLTTRGDLLTRDATNNIRLAVGTAGKFVRSDGTDPSWQNVAASDITSAAALTKVDDTNVTLTLTGSPTVSLLVATGLTLGWTGTLAVSRGGIGVGTLASNGVLYGNSTSAVQALAVNSTATNKFLTQSSSAAPAWATIATADVPSANLTVGTSLSITSGTGTGATLQALGLNTIQGITTASTPQFARLGLGAAADGTALLNMNGTTIHGNSTGVGINTTSMTSMFQVRKDANTTNLETIRLDNQVASPTLGSSGIGFYFYNLMAGIYGANVNSGDGSDGYLAFHTRKSGTVAEKMRIDNSGNVGIGTTSPGQIFDVSGKFQVASTGALTKVNNVGVRGGMDGQGFANATDTIRRGGQTASIAATGLTGTDENGWYRVSVYIYPTTAGTSGTVVGTIRWNDGAAESASTGTHTFGALGTPVFINSQVCRVTNGAAITYETTVTGAVGSPVYEIDIISEVLF